MPSVILIKDIFENPLGERHEVDNIVEFLMSEFDVWSPYAKIYHNNIADECDVTPIDEAGIDKLLELDGDLYVLNSPGGPIAILAIAFVAVAATVAVSYFIASSIPSTEERIQQAESANNSLTARTNRERLNGRIPEIFGEILSYPELIAFPYRFYRNNLEFEISYMCVGRGEYEIPAATVKDGLNPIQDIDGASAEFYGPGTSPNSGDEPFLRVGEIINEPVYIASRSNDVTGQELQPATGTGPANQNPLGPFIIDDARRSTLLFNITAQGIPGSASTRTFDITIQPIDDMGDNIGTATVRALSISFGTDFRAISIREFITSDRVSITIVQTSTEPSDRPRTINFQDLFKLDIVSEVEFGNVTTVQTLTKGTAEALAVKERKFNCLVTRRIPIRQADGTFTTTNQATTNAADIISFVSRDSFLGNRMDSEIDFDNIYDTVDEVNDYFGTADTGLAGSFSYTFDDDGTSYEEMIIMIASAIFCIATRNGNVIGIIFERSTDESTIIFNHRNKVPNSETRTSTIGFNEDFDGVEYQYVEPNNNDALEKIILPNEDVLRPRQIDGNGVRNRAVAIWQARRIYNKIIYQKETVQFTAAHEGELVRIGDRILVTDGTTSTTQEGDVLNQTGLVLTLSQNVTLQAGTDYSIFLQLPTGMTQSIAITAGTQPNQVVLASTPSQSLVFADDRFIKTTYIIAESNEEDPNAYILSEKRPVGEFQYEITAINYDENYYDADPKANGMPVPVFQANITVSENIFNYNLHDEVVALGWQENSPANVTVTINSNVTIRGTTYLIPAFVIDGFPTGSTISITNNGNIYGAGGRGGIPGLDITDVSESAATPGGVAIEALYPVTINNQNGDISGGGGGGGAGGIGGEQVFFAINGRWGGSGGGGAPLGIGGLAAPETTGLFILEEGSAGANATLTTGGAGGIGQPVTNLPGHMSGAGGAGGDLGQNGTNGANGTATGGFGDGFQGQPAGAAVDGDSLVTFTNLGTIRGPRIN